ncbi:MAG: hypothetical protein EXS09_18265 [Gemmataceae bacterium]|nr:hypothetical protein [Gemmataceae bacterium]
MRNAIQVLMLAMCWLGASASLPAADAIQPEKLDELMTLIKPGKGEDQWATIPWMTDLWQARQLAARQGKPILLWEMDGHPLGCT